MVSAAEGGSYDHTFRDRGGKSNGEINNSMIRSAQAASTQTTRARTNNYRKRATNLPTWLVASTNNCGSGDLFTSGLATLEIQTRSSIPRPIDHFLTERWLIGTRPHINWKPTE